MGQRKCALLVITFKKITRISKNMPNKVDTN